MKNIYQFLIKNNHRVILIAIIALGFYFRILGLNWDQNQHLHPDERFLTMVTQSLSITQKYTDFLDPRASFFNPYNKGYSFFVYGTFPLLIVKLVEKFLLFDSFTYNNITLAGRFISAFFDTLTIFFVYKITRLVFDKKNVALFSAFFYATSTLAIQLSHFFAVDTFLNFFLTSSIYFLMLFSQNNKIRFLLASSILFAMAIASKISAVYFLPLLIMFLISKFLVKKQKGVAFFFTNVFLILTYLTLRIFDVHLFDNASFVNARLSRQFLENISDLQLYSKPGAFFPPSLQWVNIGYFYGVKNIFFWGLGVLHSTVLLTSIIILLQNFYQNNAQKNIKFSVKERLQDNMVLMTIFIFILLFLTFQSGQSVKTMRYFLPVYPLCAVLSATFYNTVMIFIKTHNSKISKIVPFIVILLLFTWPASFIRIYTQAHTRILASEWIYEKVSFGSTLTCEHWDDCLPLPMPNRNIDFYYTQTLEVFTPDTSQKMEKIKGQIEYADYIILSSARTYKPIMQNPQIYPLMSEFYTQLFSGEMGFTKVKEFTSYPTTPILNISIKDDAAEEAFSVYDHPKVIIFQKENT